MENDSRAVVGFSLLGVALVAGAWGLSRAFAPASPASTLPDAPYARQVPPPPHEGAKPATTPAGAPQLLQRPSLSRTQIAFSFAGEIWTVPREGGEATRLVTGQLRNFRPIFSPDGSQIAFTGIYDKNADVYLVPAAGGEARRLTYHPGSDAAVGFTPDGTKIILQSQRATARDLPKLFTLPLAGGLPEELPLPSGTEAAYSPDGTELAYIPFQQWQPDWRKYRGGQTTPIYLAKLADSSITKVPRDGSNDRFPMWSGDSVYFVSDRNGPYTLFGYDTKSRAVRELVHNVDGFDVRYASMGPDAIVYEQLGKISLFDLKTGASHVVPITVSADLPQVRPHFERVDPAHVLNTSISPNGKRLLVEAHGEILSVPAQKGDARNLTQSPGVADRDPSWSPDGKTVAWLSDESGEYALYLRSPDGVHPVKRVDLGKPGSFYYAPRWSPDSKKIALTDKRLNLWLVDLEHPTPVKVDTDPFGHSSFDPAFSPDSRWLAYGKHVANHTHAVFVYSLDAKTVHQVTDGRTESSSARFDRGGKYLYLLASTDVGLAREDGMTSMGRPVTSDVYAIVLAKDQRSPVVPESDDEGIDAGAPAPDPKEKKESKDGDGDKGGAAAKPVVIDFDGIDQRIVSLPIERANYQSLEVAGPGVLFLTSAPVAFADEDYLEYDEDSPAPVDLKRFDLKKRKLETFVDGIDGQSSAATLLVSAEANKVFYQKGKRWFVVPSDEAPKDGAGAVKTDGLEVWVDPRAEWRQMYEETWRIERDFLYDPRAHGLDLAAAEKLYERFLPGMAGRDDFALLLSDMLGNLVLGHVRTRGGDLPKQESMRGGLLGADYAIEGGRYRIQRILKGENWNPKLRAPLTGPGVDVKEGDYLLAVNGNELREGDDVSRLLLGTAGKQTILTIAASPSGGGSRQVTVVPVASEGALRLRGWMEDNRKKVTELSGGRVGYVFVPDTEAFGYTNFNRYYFGEVGKDAVVIDERFNHGGTIADYIIDVLKRQPIMGAMTREGEDMTLPILAIFGPKVMLANQMSGSGGDALPWLFKKANLGTLVGTRTWGGLVGVGGYPLLIDGATVTAPHWALYGTTGQWEVENHGIAPDVEVEEDPALTRQGHDPQLERAVAIALDGLAKNPPKKLARPAYPDYGPRLPKP